MTVTSENARSGPYLGNGSTTQFAYTFRILNEAHLSVVKTAIDGTETTLTVDVDYVVSDVGNPAGGTVATTVPPSSGEKVTILRDVPLTQETDWTNQGAFYAETVEDAVDKLTMITQQVEEGIGRTVTLPPSALSSISTALPMPQADRVLGWNAAANELENKTPNTDAFLSTPVSVVQGGTSATAAGGARLNLGAAAAGANTDITSLSSLAVIDSLTEINSGPLGGRRNHLINGAFYSWARGTGISVNTNSLYTADCWEVSYGAASVLVTRQTATGASAIGPYAIRVQRDSGTSETATIIMGQSIPSLWANHLQGQTVTLSFRARRGGNFSGSGNTLTSSIRTGSGMDQNIIAGFAGQVANNQSNFLTTEMSRFTHTMTLATSITQYGIMFYYTPSGTAGVDDWFQIEAVQLEIGGTATEFVFDDPQSEEALCRRFIREVLKDSALVFTFGGVSDGNTVVSHLRFPRMFKVPVLELSSVAAADYSIDDLNGSGGGVCTNLPNLAASTPESAYIQFFRTSHGLTNNTLARLRSISHKMYLSAEL